MSSSLSSAHHWKLWSECGTGPFTDGSVGHNGSPSHYVQWPTKPGQLGHSHPTEQGGHCHQPGPTGDPGQTSGAGCHQHWHIGLFTTDVPVNHSLESSLVLVRLDVLTFCSCGFFFWFFFTRRRVILMCSGGLCQTQPALWSFWATGQTCPSYTTPLWPNSTTNLATTWYDCAPPTLSLTFNLLLKI